MKQSFLQALILCLLPITQVLAQTQENRWNIQNKTTIEWQVAESPRPHQDNIEMAGRKVVGIISYSIDTSNNLTLSRKIIFPQLHPYINEGDPGWWIYRAYLTEEYETDENVPTFIINEKAFVPGPVEKVTINGTLQFKHAPSQSGIQLHRNLYPSMTERLFIENWTLTNTTDNDLIIDVAKKKQLSGNKGAKGNFTTKFSSNVPEQIKLKSGESISFQNEMAATLNDELFPTTEKIDLTSGRESFLNDMSSNLILETPINSLNTLFEFSKIRASESIFDSELGLIHSPGGGRYYVGIWANDQAEYVSPFFPYLGYDIGNASAMSTYRAFANEINPDFNAIRYAFEIEGLVPAFMLDRGDAAMIAYGAAHYALARGDQKIGEELWPLIEWCLEYCHRKLNAGGVVASESDEMEGRIETGDANLSTSSLYFGALEHSIDLAEVLGKPEATIVQYVSNMASLESSIENYFGANVEGLDTYRYYDGHTKLRHWICLPLVVGIDQRKDATIEALFDRLWTSDGVYVEKNSDDEKNSKIFWDRGTLYAMRGTLTAGATDRTIEKLIEYTEARLLGNRVPYVVEAFPEGSMAHLSAESGLYCRIFTEGLFGMFPRGFDQFDLTPRLPSEWNEMALRSINAHSHVFDIEIERKGKKLQIKVIDAKNGRIISTQKIKDGGTYRVKL